MKKLGMLGIIGGAALLTVAPFSLQWSQDKVSLALNSVNARIGAGVHRRVYRRTYRRAAYAAAVAGVAGYGYGYDGETASRVARTHASAPKRNWRRAATTSYQDLLGLTRQVIRRGGKDCSATGHAWTIRRVMEHEHHATST